jgi:uncharacterized protein
MKRLAALLLAAIVLPVGAQLPTAAPANAGTVILMTGSAEIELPNDEAVASFFYEAQDADLAKAQSLVNQRVGDGTAALRRADPRAQIETSGYGSFPVYGGGSNRSIVGWRVRQGVTLRTDSLAALPKTVAAAQSTLSLGGISFRLSKAAREKVEAQLIQQAIANLNARIAAAAQALGANAQRVRLEEVNFGVREGGPMPLGASPMVAMSSDAVAAPTFEAGRSAERLAVSGRARLLP